MLERADRDPRRRGGLGRRRHRPRRAARPAHRRPRHRLRASPSARRGHTRTRSAARRSRSRRAHGGWRVALAGRAHRRLHAAPRLDRGRPGDAATSRSTRSRGRSRRRARRSVRRARRPRASARPRRRRRGLRGRPAPPPARRPLRGGARLRIERRTERLVREQAKLVTRPGRRADPRGAAPAERRRAGERARRARACCSRSEARSSSTARAGAVDSAEYRLVVFLQDSLGLLPISRELRRYAVALLRELAAGRLVAARPAPLPPPDRAVGARGARVPRAGSISPSALLEARAADPAEPLLRGDELGLPHGPEIGELLELIAEERAAGTISTREEALELVRRHTR